MWSTFYIQEEDGRLGAPGAHGGQGAQGGQSGQQGGGGTGGAKRRPRACAAAAGGLSESQEGKIKLAFFVALVGITLTVLGVGTEFWVELAPGKGLYGNQTCPSAHYGLWKGCTKALWVADIQPERESCGPADLPGESNCTSFKFFTTGTNAVLFQKTTEKSLNVATAMLAIFSLFMMLMGVICIVMAISKEVQFFLKPASVFFTLAGVLNFLSLIVFHQSVLSLLASDHSVPLHHELSWSVTCMGVAGAFLVLAGALFLLLALPYSPWQRCLRHRDSTS